MAKILIVEDDPSVGDFLRRALIENGHVVSLSVDGEEGLQRAISTPYELLVVDVMLPKRDGLSLIREARAKGIECPMLVITARDSLQDKIEGLDSGADDYIVKPFALGELLARTRALLRRAPQQSGILELADLVIDTAAHRVNRAGELIKLSTTEFNLLRLLVENHGRVLTRKEILHEVWQYDFMGDDNVLDVYIRYLRLKVDKGHTPLIHTVRGVGFIMSENYP